jgi:flavin reductase (DIM6/NTAB) family NADH-FMN oxidoreductase RutF
MERRYFLKTAGATALAIVVAEQMTGCSSSSGNKQNGGIEDYRKKSVKDLRYSVPDLIGNGWMLITAGTPESFNTMTASWGQMGNLFGKDVATCYIHPKRYTKEFVDREDVFTLSFFREEYRPALQICGTKSGRDTDKVKEAGLTPITTPSGSMSFSEAYMILECRKIFAQPLSKDAFTDTEIRTRSVRDSSGIHTMYVGEIIGVYMR